MAGLMRSIVGGAGLAMAVFSMGIDAQEPRVFNVIPYIPRADQPNEVFVHILNDRDVSEAFTIDLFDREGTNVAIATIYLPPRTRRWVTSRDLEHGNPEKVVFVDQLADADGSTLWGRVTPTPPVQPPLPPRPPPPPDPPDILDIFLRSESRGFITEMGQGALAGQTLQFFNPASNVRNRSSLRIVNTSPTHPRPLTIQGTDDVLNRTGNPGVVGGCTIPPLGVLTLSANDLENGPGANGCDGSWGDGVGKWTVTVTAADDDDESPIVAMSLLNREGVISNTSAIRLEPTTVIPYIPRTGQANEALIHIGNDSFASEAFTIDLFDEGGTKVATAVIYLPPNTRRWVTSRDLEHGNPEKVVFVDQLADADGSTLWGRVTPTPSLLDAFLRSRSRGFITEMGQWAVAPEMLGLFNPASNMMNQSILRIVNTSPTHRRTLTIRGTDDVLNRTGNPGVVSGCTIPPLGILTLSARDLENGPDAPGCDGAWGDGTGKWTVTVTAADDDDDDASPIIAMSLLNREGFISNTSAVRQPIHYIGDPEPGDPDPGDPDPQDLLDLVIIDGDYNTCPLAAGCVTVRNDGRYLSRVAELDWWTGSHIGIGGEYVELWVETGTPIPPLAPGETRAVVSTRPPFDGGLFMDYWACVVDPDGGPEPEPVSCSRRLRDVRF